MENKNLIPCSTLWSIEIYRGIAACLVVIYHISRHYEKNFGELPFPSIVNIGHIGVDFFFTISGFIIYYVHVNDINNKNKFFPYFIKRFSRIYPFYWLVMSATLAILILKSSPDFPTFFQLIKNVFLLPQSESLLFVGVSWTLQHEVLFYFLFSTLIFHRLTGIIVMFSWLLFVITNSYITPLDINETLLSSFNIQFFMGMFAGYISNKFKIKSYHIYFIIAFLLFFLIAYSEVTGNLNGYGDVARISYGLVSMLLIIGAVTYELANGLNVNFIWHNLGRASYSIYLTHLLFNGIYYKLLSTLGVISLLPHSASAFLLIILSIASGCVVSHFIELPLSKYIRLRLEHIYIHRPSIASSK